MAMLVLASPALAQDRARAQAALDAAVLHLDMMNKTGVRMIPADQEAAARQRTEDTMRYWQGYLNGIDRPH